jgi:two-component system nitrogen regulation sensor histidine kinase NtrY
MVFKNFRVNIIIRIVTLSVSFFLFFLLIDLGNYYITPVVIGLLIIIQIFLLITYVEKTNRYLSNFLQAIQFSDYTSSFEVEGLGTSFDHLKKSFIHVINEFQKIKSEKEEHFFYLQNIIEHIDVAILVYENNGNIKLINKAAKNLFEITALENISSLSIWNEEMKKTLLEINPNEDKLIKILAEDDLLQLAIHADEFVIHHQNVKLVSIKNIQAELEEKEMEAWQKLIRVLTHEIMNSIAPISSLTSTVNLMIEEISRETKKYLPPDFDIETIEDIKAALATIHKRSTGLIHFVDKYRNLTKIPKPNFSFFVVKSQLEYIRSLFEGELTQKKIQMDISVIPENLKITADDQLIEQVLINLIKNAIQALENKNEKTIHLKSYIDNKGRKLIQVTDNGEGIIPDVIEKIFIPFFTTKQNGSGIGLSLSRQIMRLHGGSITVFSEPDKGTIFTLSF